MTKTLPFNAGAVGLIPDQGADSTCLLAIKNKTKQNLKQKQYCKKFNTLKMVHIQKKKKNHFIIQTKRHNLRGKENWIVIRYFCCNFSHQNEMKIQMKENVSQEFYSRKTDTQVLTIEANCLPRTQGKQLPQAPPEKSTTE